MKKEKIKKNNNNFTLLNLLCLVIAFILAYVMIFKSDEPIFYTLSNIGGIAFLMYFFLKGGNWI